MPDTTTQLSAFVAYSKLRPNSASAFSSKPATKRHSSASLVAQKKSRKRSASVGDMKLNATLKKTQKKANTSTQKTVSMNSKQNSSPRKATVKRLSNGNAKLSPKVGTPNSPKKTSSGGRRKVQPKAVAAEPAVLSKLRGKSGRSIEPKSEEKVTPKKNVSPAQSRSKKTVGKKASSSAGKNKTELESNDTNDLDDSDAEDNDEAEDTDQVPLSSIDEGKQLFSWLIAPLEINPFYKTSWELAPLYVKRHNPGYYKDILSTPMIDSILRNYYLQYTKNVDITSYTDGKRETHNPVGRALPSVVWDYYMNGCSVRLLNPQTFIPKLHVLNATLQEYFGCFVGANAYLTPPNSQGFAPHYDDIEAFILQIEGKKRWRLYQPRSDNEFLPRFSSKNFDQSEIGQPIMEIILEAGDLLYFPRGTIHQGETIDGTHSLHVTLSVFQKNSWGDFFEKLIPVTLERAIATDVEFREGLPLDYLQHVGVALANKDSVDRTKFIRRTQYLLSKLVQYIDVDRAADEMAKKHIHDFLPPSLNEEEKECSVYEDGEIMEKNGVVENRVEIEPDTKVKLVRAHCVRLVKEGEGFRVYYSTENSKEYHELELQFMEVSPDLAPAIEAIILQYPNYIKVEDLPIDEEDSKIQVVKDLWEKGILVTDEPLSALE